MKKGQAAVEFAMGLSILFMIFAVFMIFITQRTAEQAEINFRVAIDTFDNFIRSEISTAASVEDGYARNFTIPPTFAGLNYTLTTETDPGARRTFVNINFEGSDIEHSINLEHSISGDFSKGNNMIIKQNGELEIES